MARRAIIAFDVDSTLLRVESLDFALARVAGERAEALAEITREGMAGRLDFRTSLERRVGAVSLSQDDIAKAAQALSAQLTPGMETAVAAARMMAADVIAVSGGFRELITPALSNLGFPEDQIFANTFETAKGRVIGFDRENPLSRNGGKADVLYARKQALGAAYALMIGDGITDFEAYEQGAAEAFIGFGGVAERPAVREKAPAYAADPETLAALIVEALAG